MSKPQRPMEGVAYYYNEQADAFCVFTCFIADPLKRSLRFQREIAADFPPLGADDPRYREEYWMDFEAARGKLIYYAFSPVYSLVDKFNLAERGFTRRFLSFDFGDQTVCLFIAQNPITQQSVVYHELSPYRETIATMQRMIYEAFAEHHGLTVGNFQLNDYLEDCIGDPHGGALAREFAEGELAVRIRCKGVKTGDGSKLEDHERGWRRSNELLAPGFWHCMKRQHPREGQGGPYALAGACHFCQAKPLPAVPLLIIMDGAAPNLVRTHADQVKEEVDQGDAETDKEKRGIEDHWWDTLRYFCQRVTIREPQAAAREDIMDRPVSSLLPRERVTRILAKRLEQQESDFDDVVRFEDGAYCIDGGQRLVRIDDFQGDESMGLYEEEL